MTPHVVAIVLNWCNEAESADCVESLLASDYEQLTVLITDNGSPDGSGDKLHARFPEVPYLQTGSNLGYAAGNNRGIDWALSHGAGYVLVINDDTLVDRGAVSRLMRTAADKGAAIVAPLIVYHDRPDTIWYGGGYLSLVRALGAHERENQQVPSDDHTREVSFVCGCCFLIGADVIRELGAFDESFFAYVEDVELSLRVSRRGYRMVYEPAARIHHRVSPGGLPSAFQIRQRDRNRRRLAVKHYSWRERALFALWFYATRMLHLAAYTAKRDWARGRAILEGAFGRL